MDVSDVFCKQSNLLCPGPRVLCGISVSRFLMKRPRSRSFREPDQVSRLPILSQRQEILRAIDENNVVILVSETGSGKTTQLPQLVLQTKPKACMVVTQPRRVAAISVASRVAKERRSRLGDIVGYAVRFDDCSSRVRTRIRYVTDGVLLRESLSKGGLSRYSHIIVDEVHERSINTDVVLSVAKRTLHESQTSRHGRSLKVIVMSATTDAAKLGSFFSRDSDVKVKVLVVPGRQFPVSTLYTLSPVQDFVDAAVTAALQIHVDYPMDGDILVFLPGQDEIHAAITLLSERIRRYMPSSMHNSVAAQPLYAALPPAEQIRAITPFETEKQRKVRKVVFATNVAETSITIEGIRYVIDTGMAKVRSLLPSSGLQAEILRLEPVSKAQADQRRGRAGRTGPGLVFRLYTEEQYDAMTSFPVPEILRVDCAGTVLQVIAYDEAAGGNGIKYFPFLDTPPRRILASALETLMSLGAIDDEMKLTGTGQAMCKIPTSPMLARSLLEACRIGCLDDMVHLAAILSVDGTIFVSPILQRDAAKQAHRRFCAKLGDHLTLVNVYREFTALQGSLRRSEFCNDHFLNYRTLSSAEAISKQLNSLMESSEFLTWPISHPLPNLLDIESATTDDLLQRCITAGFFRNAARKREEDGKYVLLGEQSRFSNTSLESGVDIHPSSVLSTGSARRSPSLIVYNDLVMTSKPYLRTVMTVDQEMLESHSGQYYAASI